MSCKHCSIPEPHKEKRTKEHEPTHSAPLNAVSLLGEQWEERHRIVEQNLSNGRPKTMPSAHQANCWPEDNQSLQPLVLCIPLSRILQQLTEFQGIVQCVLHHLHTTHHVLPDMPSLTHGCNSACRGLLAGLSVSGWQHHSCGPSWQQNHHNTDPNTC